MVPHARIIDPANRRGKRAAETWEPLVEHHQPPFDPAALTRPDPALMRYYTLCAAMTFLGFPFVIIPFYFKYRTLQYRLDQDGVSMSWGLLFKKEIHLTYRRIQDIHVTRNLFHRWLGLATISVQTASGSAGAEMTIEGVRDAEGLRDFLYQKMRGARGESTDAAPTAHAADADEALVLLRSIRDLLERRLGPQGGRS